MKTLGGIVLPEALEWDDFGQSQGIGTVHRLALDGSLVTWSGPALTSITLRAGDDYGWLPLATVGSLLALAAGTISTTLVWGGMSIPVRFDHSSGPAVNLAPLYPGAQWYTGTISLIKED